MIELVQFLTVVVGIAWFRKESREDWIRSQNTIDAIHAEVRDFHQRLVDIEQSRKYEGKK